MKIKKTLITISIIFIISLSLSAVQAFEDNQNVTADVQDIDEKTFDAIQAGFDNASDGDTILLEDTYSGSGEEMVIEKSITVRGTGSGATLNAASKSRIFIVQADDVVLENLVFTKGKIYGSGAAIAGSGAAIYNMGNNLKIINCTFLDNEGYLYGGAVFSDGDNVSVINCRFTNNMAMQTGGALELEGDNNYVDSCIFKDNIGGHVGGAVAWVGSNGVMTNSYFTSSVIDSKASQFGGAVVWMGANGQLTKSSFLSNKAKRYGAAVYWRGANGTLNYCIFENNTSPNDLAYWGNPDYANYNYWGMNIDSREEFINNNLSYDESFNAPQNWVNIVYGKTSIDFAANDGSQLEDSLPDYKITYQNQKITISDNHNVKIKTAVTASNLVTYNVITTKNGKYLQIVLKDANGRKLASKQIRVTINGHTYNVKTKSNGAAKFQVNIKKPGTYKAAIVFAGDVIYKKSSKTVKVTVTKQKPVLTLKTKTLKLKTKKKIIKVVLKDQFKKALSKKTLKITINKKTYTAKTNSKGVASFKVTLKAKKTYKYTVKFKANTYYKAVSKKGSLKVK